MIDLIRPRWWIAAAVAAFALGVVGLYSGWSSWAPMALLAGEVLAIMATITITTPSLSASLARQQAAASTGAADASVEQQEADPAQAEIVPPEDEQAG